MSNNPNICWPTDGIMTKIGAHLSANQIQTNLPCQYIKLAKNPTNPIKSSGTF